MFIVGSNAPADLAAQSVRIVIADEVGRYEASAGEEGDPLELAEQRTETYDTEALVLHLSTPLIEGTSRIAASYAESDQRIWELRCPHHRARGGPAPGDGGRNLDVDETGLRAPVRFRAVAIRRPTSSGVRCSRGQRSALAARRDFPVYTRIPRMDRRSAGAVHRFHPGDQDLTVDQVAAS
jgi:hypothetical protein